MRREVYSHSDVQGSFCADPSLQTELSPFFRLCTLGYSCGSSQGMARPKSPPAAQGWGLEDFQNLET